MSSTIVPKKIFYRVWLALLLLLLLTWGLAQFDLHHFNVVAALGIAVLKMLLVILFFMHVKYKPPLTWVFVAAGFIWLLIMIDLTLSDYLSRGAVPGNPTKSWEHGAWPPPSKGQPAFRRTGQANQSERPQRLRSDRGSDFGFRTSDFGFGSGFASLGFRPPKAVAPFVFSINVAWRIENESSPEKT